MSKQELLSEEIPSELWTTSIPVQFILSPDEIQETVPPRACYVCMIQIGKLYNYFFDYVILW